MVEKKLRIFFRKHVSSIYGRSPRKFGQTQPKFSIWKALRYLLLLRVMGQFYEEIIHLRPNKRRDFCQEAWLRLIFGLGPRKFGQIYSKSLSENCLEELFIMQLRPKAANFYKVIKKTLYKRLSEGYSLNLVRLLNSETFSRR